MSVPTNVQALLYIATSGSLGSGIYVSWTYTGSATSYNINIVNSLGTSYSSTSTTTSTIITTNLTDKEVYTITIQANNNGTLTSYSSGSILNYSNNIKYSTLDSTKASVSGVSSLQSVTNEILHSQVRIATLSYLVTTIQGFVFQDSTTLTSLVMPDTITTLGLAIFRRCTVLSNVVLSNALTIITVELFYSCKSLKKVIIPNSVITIDVNSFGECSSLKKVILGKSVTTIKYAAFYNTILQVIDLPDLITILGDSGGGNIFTSISNVTLSDSLTSLGAGVFLTTKLTSVVFPSSLTQIGTNCFEGLPNLLNVYFLGNIPTIVGSNFSSLIDTAYFFPNATNQSNLDTFFTNKVILTYPIDVKAILNVSTTGEAPTGIYVSWAYNGPVTNYVVSIINSSNVEVGTVTSTDLFTIVSNNLSEDEIYTFTVKVNNVTILSDPSPSSNFQLFTSKIKYSYNSVSSRFANVSGYKNTPTSATIMSQIRIENKKYYVTDIAANVFENCTSLTGINLPETLTTIGDFAFNGSGLTDVTLPETVSKIGNSAFNCSNLTKVNFLGNIPTVDINNFSNTSDTATYLSGSLKSNYLTMFSTKQELVDTPINIQNYLYIAINGNSPTGIFLSWETFAKITKYVVTLYKSDNSTIIYDNLTTNSLKILSESLVEGEKYSFKVQAFNNSIQSSLSTLSNTIEFNRKVKYSANIDANTSGYEIGIVSAVIASQVRITDKSYIVTSVASFTNASTLTNVTIPSTVQKLEANVFKGCEGLLNINIPNSVITIGDYSFNGCTSMSNITIPNSVITIGLYSFYGCTRISSITIPNSVKSIGTAAFYNCTSLINIKLPNSLTSIPSVVFAYCISLKSISLPKTITSIGLQAFYNCSSLSSITIPKSTTLIDKAAFIYIPKLLNVYFLGSIPTINSESFGSTKDTGYYFGTVALNYQTLNSNFTRSTQLTYPINIEALLNIPTSESFPNGIFISWDYEDVTTSYTVFVLNSSNVTVSTITQIVEKNTIITNLQLGQTYTFRVQAINNSILSDISSSNSVFYTTDIKYSISKLEACVSGYQNNPTNLYFESKIMINGNPYWVTTINESTFAGSGLTNVTINATINTIYKGAFNNCNNLKSVNFLGNIPIIEENNFTVSGDSAYYYAGVLNISTLTIFTNTYVVLDSPTNVEAVLYTPATDAFTTGIFVSWIEPPSKVTGYKITMNNGTNNVAFTSTTESIIITTSLTNEYSYTFTVVSVNNTFESLPSTISNSLFFSNTIKYSYTGLNGNVSGSRSGIINGQIASKINIAENNYIVTNIVKDAFLNNTLTTIKIPSTIISIGIGAFYSCTNLLHITIPDSVTSIGHSVFRDCINLKRVKMSNGIINLTASCFYSCISLENFTIPFSVKTIEGGVFCFTPLKKIIIPDNVTNLGSYNFFECANLTDVKLSNFITELSGALFYNTSKLLNIIIPKTIVTISESSFTNILTKIYFLGNIPTINGITFTNIYDTAYYFSTAGNTGTLTTYFTNKIVLTYPINVEAILYLPSSGTSPTGIYVSWNYSGIVTNYVVSIINNSNIEIGTVTVTSNLFAIVTTNINEGETYTFNVKVNNGTTLSQASSPSNSQLFTNKFKYSYDTLLGVTANVSGYQNSPTTGIILSQIRINTTNYYVTHIASSAFLNCTSLISIQIPETIINIRENAFKGSGITSITLPLSLTNIGNYAFDCSNLQSVYFLGDIIPTIGTNNFTHISDTAYYYPGSLNITNLSIFNTKTVVLDSPSEVQSIIYIQTSGTAPSGIFIYWIPSVAIVTKYIVTTYDNSSPTLAVYTEEVSHSLTSLFITTKFAFIEGKTYTFKVQSINNTYSPAISSSLSSSSNPTIYTKKLKYTRLSSNYASLSGCDDNLINITTISSDVRIDTVNCLVTTIAANLFYRPSNYTSLTNITIPNSINYIEDGAFVGCSGLTSIIIPESVFKIGNGTFSNCTNLSKIYFLGNVIPSIGTNNFTNLDDTAFYYPGTINADTALTITTSTTSTGFKQKVLVTPLNNPTNVRTILNVTQSETIVNGIYIYWDTTIEIVTSYIIKIYDKTGIELKTIDTQSTTTSILITSTQYIFSEGNEYTFAVQSQNLSSISNLSVKSLLQTYTTKIKYSLVNSTVIVPYQLPSLTNVTIQSQIRINNTTNYNVTEIGDNAFANSLMIESIVIPITVTKIGDWAFYGCLSLTSIIIPSSITVLQSFSFANCGLTSIDIPSSIVSIESNAFSSSTSLNTITIINPASTLTIGNAAFSGTGLTSFTIPNSIKTINDNMFSGCTKLSSIVMHSSLTNIGASAFSGCTSLTTSGLTLPPSLTIIGISAFNDCIGLTTIVIPEFMTSILDSAFKGCTQLIDVYFLKNIPSIQSNSFVTGVNMFYFPQTDITNLQAFTNKIPLSPPNNIQPQLYVSSSGSATNGILVSWESSLTKLTQYDITLYDDNNVAIYTVTQTIQKNKAILAADTALVSGKTYKFGIKSKNSFISTLESSKSTSILYSSNIIYSIFGSNASVNGFQNNPTNESILTQVNINGSNYTVTKISNLTNCSTLTSIILPPSITILDNNAFENCTSLLNITIPNSVIDIGTNAFKNCTSLSGVTLPSIFKNNTIPVSMFNGCIGLTTISIPSSVTNIESFAFNGCTNLSTVNFLGDIPTISSNNFTSTNDTAYYYSNYSSNASKLNGFFTNTIQISLVATNVEVMYNVASGTTSGLYLSWTPSMVTITSCSVVRYKVSNGTDINEETITITPLSLSSKTVINIFDGSVYKFKVITNGIESVFSNEFLYNSGINYSLNNSLVSVSRYDGNLESLTVPSKVSINGIKYNVTGIDSSAFINKSLLKTITLPDTLVSIGDNAFKYSKLVNIVIPNSVTSIGISAFQSCTSLTSVTLSNTLISIGNFAFSNTGITTITLPNTLTSIGSNAFSNTNLVTVFIPNLVTLIDNLAFIGCANLTNINVSLLNPNYLSDNGILFNKLKTILIQCPASKILNAYLIPNTVITIINYAFSGCVSLTDFTIPSTLSNINDYAFQNCIGLTRVYIPQTVINLSNTAFDGCIPTLQVIFLSKQLTFYISDLSTHVTAGKALLYIYVPETLTGDVNVEVNVPAYILNNAFCFKTTTPAAIDITKCSFKIVPIASNPNFSGILPKSETTNIVYGSNSGYLSSTQSPATIPYEFLSMISKRINNTTSGISGIIGIDNFVSELNTLIDNTFNAKLQSLSSERAYDDSTKYFIQEILLNVMSNDSRRFLNISETGLGDGWYPNVLQQGDVIYYTCSITSNQGGSFIEETRKYLYKLTLT